MRVMVLYNEVRPDASPDERDVLIQVKAVSGALERLGHEPATRTCTSDLTAMASAILQARPDVVFNLVESLEGSDRLAYRIPAVIEALGLACTGSSSEALLCTINKLEAKQRLRGAGLPTPAWEVLVEQHRGARATCGGEHVKPPYIIKAIYEHASFGLDDHAVVRDRSAGGVQDRLRGFYRRWNRDCFAEAYIEGREFNLSLLAGRQGPQVLPIAEIDFAAFPPGKPRIVGYRAKWAAQSFEYHHTPRRFDFDATDQMLLDKLAASAQAAWALFGLGGFARVDFRVDRHEEPWILEINANPCLSPDAGFAAALMQARIPFEQAIGRMLDDALRRTLQATGSA